MHDVPFAGMISIDDDVSVFCGRWGRQSNNFDDVIQGYGWMDVLILAGRLAPAILAFSSTHTHLP